MNLKNKKDFNFLIVLILITDLVVFLDIPFLRQILGFVLLTLLPGFLIIRILKFDEMDFLGQFILTWGLSISFVMLFGLLINLLSLSVDYKTPLETNFLLFSLNIVFVLLWVIAYKINRYFNVSLPNFNLTKSEKAFLIVPILFPALGILGMHIINTTDNNIILMILLFLIPIYIISICFLNNKFPKRMYPVVIFLISISLLLLLSLRSNHIIGIDTHQEYYFFKLTLDNLHWRVFEHSILDSVIAISMLPTIYQSILNIPPEFLYKILPSIIYSISPLVIYVISKKYIEEGYAFLASCFYMFQSNFLFTEYNARANIAMLFFALAMMVLFYEMNILKKRIIFIIFMVSSLLSHYSTTYIFFFVIVGAFIGQELLSKKYKFVKMISVSMLMLFFVLMIFWYSQITETAFNSGVRFIENMIGNLNKFFIEESRGSSVPILFGKDVETKGIPHKIQFAFTWLTFVFIGIGIITLLIKYKEMSFPELNFKKQYFLKEKFEVCYLLFSFVCLGLLISVVALPYIAVGYGLDRMYPLAITFLSVFFVIGGIIMYTYLNGFFAVLRNWFKIILKNHPISLIYAKKNSTNVIFDNTSRIRTYFVILLVLIPYFFTITGVMYNLFDYPRSIILNSKGEQYDNMKVYDQESYALKWVGAYAKQKKIYPVDWLGYGRSMSQGGIPDSLINYEAFAKHETLYGYIFLGYHNIVDGSLYKGHKMSEYSYMFTGKNRIYNNGGSEIWR